MKIARLELHAYHLPLARPWQSAAGSFTERQGWLLRLTTTDGRTGYGDCAPLPEAGSEAAAAALGQLRRWQKTLPGAEVGAVLGLLAGGDATADATPTPAARCGLETALLDLLAREADVPLWRLLGGSKGEVAVNAAAGALESLSAADLTAATDAGFRVLKIKIGKEPPVPTLHRLATLAARLPAGVTLRLDANCAYDETAARTLLTGLAGLPIEAVEEPLREPTASALAGLQASVAFPLALDESLPAFHPDTLCLEKPVRRVVLKPARDGGLLPALSLARRAAGAGLECVVTGTVDCACGTLAAAHLAAAVGGPLAHGLSTSDWLAADLGTPPEIAGGRLTLSADAGLGFVPGIGCPAAA